LAPSLLNANAWALNLAKIQRGIKDPLANARFCETHRLKLAS